MIADLRLCHPALPLDTAMIQPVYAIIHAGAIQKRFALCTRPSKLAHPLAATYGLPFALPIIHGAQLAKSPAHILNFYSSLLAAFCNSDVQVLSYGQLESKAGHPTAHRQ